MIDLVPRAHLAMQTDESRHVTNYYNARRRYHIQGGGNLCSTSQRRRRTDEDDIEIGTPRRTNNYSPSRSAGTPRENTLSSSGVPPSFQGVEIARENQQQPIDIVPTVTGIPVDDRISNEARRIWNKWLNHVEYRYIRNTLNTINSESFVPQFRNVYLEEYQRYMFAYIDWYRRSSLSLDERERQVPFYLVSLQQVFRRLNRNPDNIAIVEEYREERGRFTGAGCCSSRVEERAMEPMIAMPVITGEPGGSDRGTTEDRVAGNPMDYRIFDAISIWDRAISINTYLYRHQRRTVYRNLFNQYRYNWIQNYLQNPRRRNHQHVDEYIRLLEQHVREEERRTGVRSI
jgi:hypothetical protein